MTPLPLSAEPANLRPSEKNIAEPLYGTGQVHVLLCAGAFGLIFLALSYLTFFHRWRNAED